jgi:hypothetical protein
MENTNEFEMKLDNKKVFEFYKNNPSLNFETINVLCVELFENILQDTTITLNNTITKQILSKCMENNCKLDDINRNMTSNLVTINNNISKLSNELIIKFIDIKKEYIEEVKNIVNINTFDKFEKMNIYLKELFEKIVSTDDLREITDKKTNTIIDFIEKNNCNLNDKTIINNHSLINDIDKNCSSKLDKFDDKINILINKINAETLDKFNYLISSSNTHIIDKINIMLNQCLPENNTKINKQIHEDINHFYLLISEETKKITQNDNEQILHTFIEKFTERNFEDKLTSKELLVKQDIIITELNNAFKQNSLAQIDTFITNFDNKYHSLLQTIQQPIFEILNNNEERIIKNITTLNDSTTKQQSVQDKMFNNLDDFLNKYKNNSSSKGKYSENYLKKILEQIEGSEVIDTSKITSSGDLLLKRINKSNILFENKEYENTLPTSEVDKFIYDCNKQKMHGIILSQSSGIALKKNYQIEIFDKKYILVYVSNVEYTFDKIKIAIDIIDSLSEKLKEHDELPGDETDNCNISKELLQEINEEFNKVISQKETIINLVKEFQKKIIISIDDIKLPSLQKIVYNYFPSNKILQTITCNRCNIFVAKSKSSLAAHHKSCIYKNEIVVNTIIDTIDENNNVVKPIEEIANIFTPKIKKQNKKEKQENQSKV